MAKTVTLRIDDETYQQLKKHAELDHRPLSNFIEFATKKFIEESLFADAAEMLEILGNDNLLQNLKRGSQDAAKRKGKFVFSRYGSKTTVKCLFIIKRRATFWTQH
jgi:predicted DNA-binding protein